MRNIIYSHMLLLVAMALSCKKSDAPLKVDSTSLHLSSVKNSLDSFTILYSGNWSLTINPSTSTWLKVNVMSGKGNTKVYVSSEQENLDGAARTANIIIVPSGDVGKAAMVNVIQSPLDFAPYKKVYGGSFNEQFATLIPTLDGGHIGVGTTASSDGDVSGNHGIQDIWVVRVDKSGSIVWQKTYGGSNDDFAQSAVEASDGGILIVGASSSSNGDVSGGHGGYDMWVLKIDTAGNKLWQKSFGGSKLDFATAVTASTDGGYLIAGLSQSTDGDVTQNYGKEDIWLMKIDGSGNKQWEKTFGGTNYETPFSIAKTLDGGYVVVGNMYDYASNGEINIYILKIDGSGNMVWQKTFSGPGMDAAKSIIATADGKYLLTGFTTSSSGDFDNNHGSQDAWLLRLDELGNKMWLKMYGGTGKDEGDAVIATSDGFVMVGQSESTDGDVVGNKGLKDAWVVKVDGGGNIVWQKTFGGKGDDRGLFISSTGDGGYVVAGQTSSTEGDIVGQHGSADAWVVKFKE